MVNSRQKGKRVERAAAAALNAIGFETRRGVQYSGGPESPDVVGIAGLHIEVKGVEKLNIDKAMAQSIAESAKDEIPVVLHKKNRGDWLLTLRLDDLASTVKLLNQHFDVIPKPSIHENP